MTTMTQPIMSQKLFETKITNNHSWLKFMPTCPSLHIPINDLM